MPYPSVSIVKDGGYCGEEFGEDPALEPVADDVASLALDLLVREAGYRRGGINPFLLGY